jgi:hypothetical protein
MSVVSHLSVLDQPIGQAARALQRELLRGAWGIQSNNGLPQTGIVDTATWAKLSPY